jgi:hypothetical protein
VNTTVVGVLLAAAILSSSGYVAFSSSQIQTGEQLNEQFNTVMNGTMGFLDHSWDVAQKFQNISYSYDPSELGNFTVPEAP